VNIHTHHNFATAHLTKHFFWLHCILFGIDETTRTSWKDQCAL